MGHDSTRTTVYQYYDKMGMLLYVGVTDRGPARSHEHAATKSWWWFASGCTMEHFATRELALAREKELIEGFRPPYNKQHNPTPLPYRQPASSPATALHPDRSYDQRRRDWYALPREERLLTLCVSCGLRPSSRRGPSCDMCMAPRRARKSKYAPDTRRSA